MEIKIEKNYLVFPTNRCVTKKRLRFFENGKEVYYINVRLDETDPDFYAYVDMRRFIGKTLTLEIFPFMRVSFTQADEMPDDERDGCRPYIHFTPKRGWLNDPNGLIKLGDDYHLFYQFNPAERAWENMHWGHAVSKDLLHWNDLPTALFPDATGTMYSGCAVLDKGNVSRLGKDGNAPVLLYYTAAGNHASAPVNYTQCLAYSTDDLKTIEKYDGNPVVDYVIGGNRDPKVVWCEECNAYVMSLYLDKDEYVLYLSTDLLQWKELQRLHIAGENECPNFFPINTQQGERKWVFIGAHEIYLIGSFVNEIFVPDQKPKRMYSASNAYAAQMFTDMPNDQVIRIPWIRWQNNFVAKTFTQQMGIPCGVQLEKCNDEYYLSFLPVSQLQTLSLEKATYENVKISEEKTQKYKLGDYAVKLSLQGEYAHDTILKMTCFGVTFTFNFTKNEIVTGGAYINPLSITQKRLDVQMIIDKTSIEVFCDNGKIVYAIAIGGNANCDYNLPYVEFYANKPYAFAKIETEKLARVWEK